MTLQRHLILAIGCSCALFILASCATRDPSARYLTLDLRGESVPVMLNNPDDEPYSRTLMLESGYQVISHSASSGNATARITVGTPLNQPLGTQVQAMLSDSMAAVFIDSLELQYTDTNNFLSADSDIRRLQMTIGTLHQ